MPTDIPVEAQDLIRQFEAEEAARKAVRELNRKPAKEILILPRRQMTSKEIEKEARKYGLTVEPGNGKHGKHIVARDGSRVSLPDHPGNLATGTCLSINEFLRQHRER